MAKLWLTRPLDDSERFSQTLAEQGIECLIAPVMSIAPVPFSIPPYLPDALIVTSKHVAPALAKFSAPWRALPVYCVGKATGDYVREVGFTRIIPGKSDAMALLPQIMQDFEPSANILYLSGDEIQINIPHILGGKGYMTERLVVYQAIAEEALSDTLKEAISQRNVSGVCFFSPRSAMITASLLRSAGLVDAARDIHAFCFSLSVAKAAGTLPWKQLHACHKPTLDAMRELVISKWPRA